MMTAARRRNPALLADQAMHAPTACVAAFRTSCPQPLLPGPPARHSHTTRRVGICPAHLDVRILRSVPSPHHFAVGRPAATPRRRGVLAASRVRWASPPPPLPLRRPCMTASCRRPACTSALLPPRARPRWRRCESVFCCAAPPRRVCAPAAWHMLYCISRGWDVAPTPTRLTASLCFSRVCACACGALPVRCARLPVCSAAVLSPCGPTRPLPVPVPVCTVILQYVT